MSTVSAPPVPAGRALFDGWRHAVAVVPAVLVLAVLTTFDPYVTGGSFLAMLVGAAMLRPMSLARLGGLAAGLATGLVIAYGALIAMLAGMDL